MIHFPNEHLDLECLDTRETVAEACARAGHPLDLVCGGTGRCGQCKILIKNHGITLEVLACQYPVFDEMEILTGAEARQQILDRHVDFDPLILDPVGAGASDFRQRILKTLLERLHFTCIRGNQSEMAALLGVSYPSRGVEEAGVCLEPDRLQELSERYDTVLAVTGETDLTVSKDRILVSHTGTPLQKRITGSGCMLSGLLAAALAGSTAPSSGPALRLSDTSGIASLVHETVKAYGCLASEAEKEMEASSSHGTMAFRSRLIDAVSTAGL